MIMDIYFHSTTPLSPVKKPFVVETTSHGPGCVHDTGLFCSRNWDGWLCWDDAPAGTFTSQNCPNYFVDFDPTGETDDL